MRGPPELPGLMAASVWIRFCRFSVDVPAPPAVHRSAQGRDDALGDRRCAGGQAERVADGHDGVADDRLLRIAEGHGGEARRVVDLEQRDVLRLVVADERRGQALGLPVLGDGDGPASPLSVYSSITWLLVTTSPSDVMIMPVPSSSLWLAFTSMETTAGMTLFTSSGMVTFPLSTAAPGEAVLSWIVTRVGAAVVVVVVGDCGDPGADAGADQSGHERRREPGAPPASVAEVADVGGRRRAAGRTGGSDRPAEAGTKGTGGAAVLRA